MRLLDHEKTLDEQIRDIKQGNDSKNLMRLLPKTECYTYSKKQKEARINTNAISFHALELYRKLKGVKGLEKFIGKAAPLKGKSNKEKQVLGNKYKVSIIIVNRAIDKPDVMRAKFRKTKERMKLKGMKG